MASTKGGESLEQTPDRDAESVASGSGVRVERETTPAPPGASEEWATLPSARPTCVPAYDVTAHAFETSMRHQALPSLPLDVAVPSRTSLTVPSNLELRAAFLLLHVDGRSSVQQIADLTGLPVDDVFAELDGLRARGLVDLIGTRSLHAPPQSGERSKP